jgi:hypothetical protein
MLVGEHNPCNRNGARPILPYPRGCALRCFTELKPLRPVVLMPLPCRPRRDKWQRNGLRFLGQRTLPRDGTFFSVAKASPPRRCLYRKLDSAIIIMKSARSATAAMQNNESRTPQRLPERRAEQGGHGAVRIGRHPMTASKDRQWIWNGRPASKLTGEEFLWNEAVIPMHKTRSSD